MNPLTSPLLTDLYELTMMQAYHDAGMEETAVFELFVRKLPPGRNFLVAAGLEQALAFVEQLRFGPEELEWLERSGHFTPPFLDRLERFRFTGDIHALPEGTVFFPDEPVLRVTAPIAEAQLLETRLVNLIHLQTTIASKAARAVLAAPGKALVDFGLRRAHGAEAGLLAARASYLAGFSGTSTVLAASLFGVPAFGTMAHSFIQAHDSEVEAFEHFAASFPSNALFLIDTYDTVEGARRAAALAERLRRHGASIRGVRLDSGDIGQLAREVRAILDAAGLKDALIFASGNLDEYRVADLVAGGAPIDSFGIGTSLVTSSDAPTLDMVYKLQEYAGRPRRKRSTGKATWPGRKQVWRRYDDAGTMCGDTVALEGQSLPGEQLLQPVMRAGRRTTAPTLEEARRHAASQLAGLPPELKRLDAPSRPYPVTIDASLHRLAAEVDSAEHEASARP